MSTLFPPPRQLQWQIVDPLTEDNVRRHVPEDIAGVYVLVRKSKDKFPVFYVGQGDPVLDRLLDHLSQYEQNLCIKRAIREYHCFCFWAHVPRQADRDGIERYLIGKFDPECNKNIPKVAPIRCNLPF